MSETFLTTVFDVGARYGMHPSWTDFRGPVRYVAFEPDSGEARRLRDNNPGDAFQVHDVAFDKEEGTRRFNLLRHRGLSSFLTPDPESECFRHLKPGQAEVEKVIDIETRTIDSFVRETGIRPDFLKIDTEGTEQDVVEGAATTLEKGILGVRSSCNFQPCFHGQKIFSTQHDYMMEHGFVLLNIDYRGYGYPRLGLFRKPDPMGVEDFRYGILVHADGVWIRKPQWIIDTLRTQGSASADAAFFKLAYFCMLNNAPDVGVDLLRERAGREGPFSDDLKASALYRAIRLHAAKFLGQWRTVPDAQWDRSQSIFRDIFATDLAGGSDFYPQVQAWERALLAATGDGHGADV